MMFGLLQPGRASGVVGKWYCSQAFLDSLYLSAVCNEYKGIFEFRNDGTFRLNVSGSTAAGRRHVSTCARQEVWPSGWHGWRRTIYIRLRGRYSVAGGVITTEVDPGSVKCYSNSGLDNPDMSDETMSNAELRYMEYQEEDMRKPKSGWQNTHSLLSTVSGICGSGTTEGLSPTIQ